MKVIIIGGVAAGTKAAAKIKRLKPETEVIIYTDDTNVSYSECGFPYFIEGLFDDVENLFARSVNEFKESGVIIHLEHECIKILPDDKKVLIKNKDAEFLENYDILIIATGARPFIPPIKNVGLKNAFTLRKVEDALAIKEILKTSKNAVIIGGGYIGIELLEAFVKNNLECTMIEAGTNILPIFDEDVSMAIQKEIFSDKNPKIKFISSDCVTEFYGTDKLEGVITKSGLNIKTDFVIIAAGVKPNVEIARDAGIVIGQTGAIKVNNKMQTNIENIYAAGDCVEKNHIVSKTPVWVPLGSTANKEGRCAAINICGKDECFDGILGSAVTRYFDYNMSMTGLTEKDAKKLGFDPISSLVTKSDKVSYMPDAKEITVKLIADKATRRLIGTQIVGYGDADKRVNSVTSALLCNATVDDLLNDDLTYAPPFSPSIDPLLTACEQLINKLNNIK